MKVVVAIDSLKGSLTSFEAGHAIKDGIHRVYQDAQVVVSPLADGGEGTVESLVTGMNGTYQTVEVTGPLGAKVNCQYGILEESKTAIIEMSGAAGITLINRKERNPLLTTTYGVGEVITDAIHKGCRNFIVGIGGSATNDGGVGMLQALGFEFLDAQGNEIVPGAEGLKDLTSIKLDHALAALSECTFKVACDVNNPLCGELGASAVYGPQKGATPEMVQTMDGYLGAYADITAKTKGTDNRNVAGTGAAGGMGFAFISYLNATLSPGIQIILEETKLEDEILDADIVITGEGMLDFQTAMGKAPIGVAKLAKKHNKKTLAFAGGTTDDAQECNRQGIDAYFAIVPRCMDLDTAMKAEVATKNLTNTVEQAFRIIKAF